MPESANEHLDWLREYLTPPPSTVVDVGMGRGNYGWWLRYELGYTGKLFGIEVWAPYVSGDNPLAGGNLTYYDEVIVGDVRDPEIQARMQTIRPEVTFAFDVIEHLPRMDGIRIVAGLARMASKALLVSLPIVPYPQGALHGNPHEIHRYDWSIAEMNVLGGTLAHPGAVTGMFVFSRDGAGPGCCDCAAEKS